MLYRGRLPFEAGNSHLSNSRTGKWAEIARALFIHHCA